MRTAWMMALGLMLLSSSQAFAHQFAPSLLEVEEIGGGRTAVRWKQPAARAMGSELRPVLPVDCRGIGRPEVVREGTGVVATWEMECATGLIGKAFSVEGLPASKADALLRVQLEDGRSFRQVLTGDEPEFVVPERESRAHVMKGYAVLGVEHILTGWDHLLFVLGLVLLVGWGRTLLWTVTAFTVGHSITLALAVLGVVNVSQGAIEILIAASIYFLAIELIDKARGVTTLVERLPWLVAGAFGLLHGLGFASALSEVGLPPDEIPLALFSFNLGIEAGQLLFVCVVVAARAVLARIPVTWPRWTIRAPAYAIGTLAVFWFLERLGAVLRTLMFA